MKKLTTQINESLQTVINESADPIVKSVESLLNRIGLKQLKTKISDSPMGSTVIGKLLMEPKDAGMMQPCFKDIDLTVTLIRLDYRLLDKYRLELEYRQRFHTGSATTDAIYNTVDGGKTWTDANGKQV